MWRTGDTAWNKECGVHGVSPPCQPRSTAPRLTVNSRHRNRCYDLDRCFLVCLCVAVCVRVCSSMSNSIKSSSSSSDRATVVEITDLLERLNISPTVHVDVCFPWFIQSSITCDITPDTQWIWLNLRQIMHILYSCFCFFLPQVWRNSTTFCPTGYKPVRSLFKPCLKESTTFYLHLYRLTHHINSLLLQRNFHLKDP